MASLSDILLAKTGHQPRKGSTIDQLRNQHGVRRSAEYNRIANLPRRTLEHVPDLTHVWLRSSKCPGCELCKRGVKLRPIQSAALWEAEALGGLFAPIGVGHGKELICLLLPDALQAKRAVILTKPRLKSQMQEVDIPRYNKHFKLPLQNIRVVSYSELSSAKSADVLEEIQPDAIVANEVHCLRHKSAARTKRFLHYMKEHPECKFAGLSGTIANRSLKDYGHLIDLALRHQAPLPSGWRELEDWARALDVIEEELALHPGSLLDLCGPEVREEESKEGLSERQIARRVYQRRLIGSPGVVATTVGSCEASLIIEARQIKVPQVVNEVLDKLRQLWRLEDEDFSDAMQMAAKAKQVASGFYYRWVWPGGKKDHEWLEARSAWYKEVRHVLRYKSRPGLDSPLLVANAAERREIESATWEAWKQVKSRYHPHPPHQAVWLSNFLVTDIIEWADAVEESAPGIIWYADEAMGEALKLNGLPIYGGGEQGDRILQSRERVVAASIHARRDGDNLQHFQRNLVVTAPANGTIWEQCLGRTHRAGQEADEIECEVYVHDASLTNALTKAIADARFLEEAHGTSQKLIDATKIGLEFIETEEQWNEI